MIKIGRLLLLFSLLAAIGWAAYNMGLITYKKYTQQKQILELKAQAEVLAKKQLDLQSFLDSFEDPAILEQQLKSRLNLKKEGEEVVVIVPASPAGGPEGGAKANTPDEHQTAEQLLQNLAAVELQKEKNTPNWQKWWQAFFGESSPSTSSGR